MLLYDWGKIFKSAKGNPSECILIFKMLTEGLIPKNKKDPLYKYYTKDFVGSSYIAHPEVLLYNRYKHTNTEIGQYLAIASIRSLAEYYASGKTWIDLLQVDVNPKLFENNSLLYVENDELHFLYEEVPTEKH
jgi:hypothetical protein